MAFCMLPRSHLKVIFRSLLMAESHSHSYLQEDCRLEDSLLLRELYDRGYEICL